MARAGVEHKGVLEDGEAGDGSVGVDDVEGGVGKVGGAEVVVELVAAGCGLDAGGNEAELLQGEVDVAEVGGEAASEHAGDDAAKDGVAGEGAGGGGVGGGGG